MFRQSIALQCLCVGHGSAPGYHLSRTGRIRQRRGHCDARDHTRHCPWGLHEGVSLTRATNVTLTLRNLTLADAGDYRVVVSNFGSSQTSQVARLTLREPPAILSQPISRESLLGGGVDFVALVADHSHCPGGFRCCFRCRGDRIQASLSVAHEWRRDQRCHKSNTYPAAGFLRKGTGAVITLYDVPGDFSRFYRIVAE